MPTVLSVARRLATWSKFIAHNRQDTFRKIFRERYWGDDESVSGIGSSLAQTANIRRQLPVMFEKFGIRTVYDAPCGDFYWMREVVAASDIDYTGADIVPEVIEKARENAGDLKVRFAVADIVEDPLPRVDLWICRDCLFHLNYSAILAALRNFAASGSTYILLTTNAGDIRNRNIVSGDFRPLDMHAEPFNLPRDALFTFDDFAAPLPPRSMILLDREQVSWALKIGSDRN